MASTALARVEATAARAEPATAVEKDPIGDWLEHQEKKIFDASVKVLDDALLFRDIDPSSDVIPGAWVRDLGLEEAQKRFRLAKAAWMNAKEAPVGIKIAKELVTGIAKARSREQAGPRVLNLTKVVIQTGAPSFPEMEVEK
jgi:hypothetical protein